MKKNTIRRIIAAALALIMVLSMTACGKQEPAPAPETGDTFALGLWLTVAALTAAAGAILVLRRREEA